MTDEEKYLTDRHWIRNGGNEWLDPMAPPDVGGSAFACALATQRARDAAEERNVVGQAIANAASRHCKEGDVATARVRVERAADLALFEYRRRFGAGGGTPSTGGTP